MPLPASFAASLRTLLGPEHVIAEPEQLRVYECDGLTGHRALPELVVLPGTTEDVREIVRACNREHVPFVARGAGTGLSGGATPVAGGVVISLARMNRILEVDVEGQRVVVEPGVANLDVTRAVEGAGFFYAPDPSSQQVCTIGGNVAENSGGAHCLKNGFTVHHVTGLTLVLPDGEVVELGGKALDPDGPDLLGLVVGSEGTLGVVTRITLRILRAPEAVRTLLAEAILDACLDAGGSLTGEHGVGMDKACSMPRMFSERDLAVFEQVRRAFDPEGLCNPGKVIPTPRLCGEVPGPYRVHPLERIGVAERL
jgi:glycolate oxidase